MSVDTVRYYQSRGLLPQPAREGRLAWYGEEHADRIRRIRDLQKKGLTLAAIGRVVRGELGEADADLAAAVAEARGDTGDGQLLSLDEFAGPAGVPASLIQAVEREGIRLGRPGPAAGTLRRWQIDDGVSGSAGWCWAVVSGGASSSPARAAACW